MALTETDAPTGIDRSGAPDGHLGADEVTLEELTRLALAADPDAPLPEGAVPLGPAVDDGPLPSWYMPAATTRRLRGGRGVAVAVLIVAALLMIVASGLCITYGQLTIA